MATFEVFWDDPDKKRAVVRRFNGGISWDDLNTNCEKILDLHLEIPYVLLGIG